MAMALAGRWQAVQRYVAYLIVAVLVLRQVEAAVVKYDWTVDYASAAPDCVSKLVLSINGECPSPTIYAVEGDTVVVKLTNALATEGIAIQWHGMQRELPFYNGVPFVSQRPINPSETFTYRFKVDRAGTYFYHGHFGKQRTAGLVGSLIVSLPQGKAELFPYDESFYKLTPLDIIFGAWPHAFCLGVLLLRCRGVLRCVAKDSC